MYSTNLCKKRQNGTNVNINHPPRDYAIMDGMIHHNAYTLYAIRKWIQVVQALYNWAQAIKMKKNKTVANVTSDANDIWSVNRFKL